MSWESKTDYCGLAVANKVVIKSSTMNRSGQYLEKTGASGAIVATKPYGTLDAPSCEYAIKAANSFAAGAIKLGAVTTVDNKRYALQSVHYECGAAQEPVFSGTAQEIEATTDGTQRTFDVPAFDISPDEIAAIIMSAATLGGAGCELTKATMDASATVNNHTVNGVPVASGVSQGKVTVALEILQTSTTAPTVTAASGWDVSSPLSCNDPDSDLPTWTVTLSKPLAYTVAATT
jgi:hypothetical protein